MRSNEPFAQWAIIEQLGHKRLAGYVQEQEIAGCGFLRLDVPGPEGGFIATQFIQPSTVYALTPVSEETARALAAISQPTPVHRWELPPVTDRRDAEEDGGGEVYSDPFADDE